MEKKGLFNCCVTSHTQEKKHLCLLKQETYSLTLTLLRSIQFTTDCISGLQLCSGVQLKLGGVRYPSI